MMFSINETDYEKYDIAVAVDVDYLIKNNDPYHKLVPLTCLCRASLLKLFDDFRIINVKRYTQDVNCKGSIYGALSSFANRTQVEEVTKNFLNKYYPEALIIPKLGKKPVAINPFKLAERMNLKILEKQIGEMHSVFGKAYFLDTKDSLYGKTFDVEANTIIVDPDAMKINYDRTLSEKIVHECVHFNQHRGIFKLAKLYGEKIHSISCGILGFTASTLSPETRNAIEKQADQLTSSILMPAEPFKAKADEYIEKRIKTKHRRFKVDREVFEYEVMESVIKTLARDFDVSIQSCEIRLMELGYDQALGSFINIDGNHISPHGFKKGAITLNQTFSISQKNAFHELENNPGMLKLIEEGDYLYIDSHFVYKAPLYLKKNNRGRYKLTDYVLAHMDECCLVFEKAIDNHVDARWNVFEFCYTYPTNYTYELKYRNGFENEPEENQIKMRKEEQEQFTELHNKMQRDKGDCLGYVIKLAHTNQTKLAKKCGVSRETISRIRNDERDIEFNTLIKICFGLELAPDLIFPFIRTMGFELEYGNSAHGHIRDFLYLKYSDGAANNIKELEKYGVYL